MALLRTMRRAAQVRGLKALVLAASLSLGAASIAAAPGEYQIKAVFLFNFSQFVDWPPEAFPAPDTPFVIGVLGSDPFGASLDETVRGEMVGGRPFVVKRYRKVGDIGVCHILFVAPSERARLDAIVKSLQGRNILTVSDIEGAAHSGIAIRFVAEKSRIRLRINVAVARAAGLTISSKLLRPAELVSS